MGFVMRASLVGDHEIALPTDSEVGMLVLIL